MKTSIIIASIILCCSVNALNAQDTVRRKMVNSTRVTLIANSTFHSKGALYQVKDSSIILSSSTRYQDYTRDLSNYSLNEIDVIDIQLIKTGSKNRARKGALIGASIGIITGVVLGLASDGGIFFDTGDLVIGGGLLFGATGAVTGAIIGSIGINIPINGSMENYNRKKARLAKYSIYK